jgi:hypothetical protein
MTDLGDFGGGVDHDAGPEDGVRQDLSTWLRTGRDVQVYWDRDHDHGWSTFDISTNARPDLLIDSVSNTYAVEVKVGDDSGKIHDGFAQLVRYWQSYVDDDATYRVNGQRKNIDAFLLATGNAPHGRLYKAEGESDVLRTGTGEGRQRGVAKGELPAREFNATERAMRVSWRLTKQRRPEAQCGIGALLSSRLDDGAGGYEHATPATLYKSHGGVQPDGWSDPGYQWWQYIPFYADGGDG